MAQEVVVESCFHREKEVGYSITVDVQQHCHCSRAVFFLSTQLDRAISISCLFPQLTLDILIPMLAACDTSTLSQGEAFMFDGDKWLENTFDGGYFQ